MPPQDLSSIWTEVQAASRKLLGDIKDNVPKGPIEMPTHYAHILGMFWRSVRLYEGTLVLLGAQLPEEAMILARSLFEESLQLRELNTDESKRDALILRWINTSINEKIGLIKTAESFGIEPDGQAILDKLCQDRLKLRRYAQRHNIAKPKAFLSPKDAANQFGRGEDYWTYSWSHEAVHGSDAAWLFARTEIRGGVALHDRTKDPGLRASFAAYAAESVMDAAEATSSIFQWEEFESAKRTFHRIRELKEVLDTYADP